MLPKRLRLTTPEVALVLRSGRSRRATYLSSKVLQTDSPLKISVVVSKSVARKAVERNRLRRAVYRALDIALYQRPGFNSTGKAVVFVQKVPHEAKLTPIFVTEVALLFKNAML